MHKYKKLDRGYDEEALLGVPSAEQMEQFKALENGVEMKVSTKWKEVLEQV